MLDASVRELLSRHLKAARRFVLLASPAAAQSRWVQFEVESWLSFAGADRILLVLLDGEIHWDTESNDFDWIRTSALPRSLAGRFPSEPLYADLRIHSARGSIKGFRNVRLVAAMVAAALDEVDFDTLVARDARTRR